MIPATGPRKILLESHRILQENTGNRWSMEAVFRPEIVRIFSGGFLSTSCAFRQEPAGTGSFWNVLFDLGCKIIYACY
jgi:hypothetical protein